MAHDLNLSFDADDITDVTFDSYRPVVSTPLDIEVSVVGAGDRTFTIDAEVNIEDEWGEVQDEIGTLAFGTTIEDVLDQIVEYIRHEDLDVDLVKLVTTALAKPSEE